MLMTSKKWSVRLLIVSTALAMTACGVRKDGARPESPDATDITPPPPVEPARAGEPPMLAGITANHNDVRRQVDPSLPDLAWSDDLARTAQAWANRCRFQHNDGRGEIGENLAAYTDATGSAQATVSNWASEAADYGYDSNACAPGKVCGHYTQVIWRSTTRVGCAVAACSDNSPFPGFTDWQIWVCNYSPPGNYIGQRPY